MRFSIRYKTRKGRICGSVRPCNSEKLGESNKGSPTHGLGYPSNQKAERAGVLSPYNLGLGYTSGLHLPRELMCGCKGAAREVSLGQYRVPSLRDGALGSCRKETEI